LRRPNLKPAPQVPPPYVAASVEPSAARAPTSPTAGGLPLLPHEARRDGRLRRDRRPFSGGDVEADEVDPAFEFQAPNLTPDPKSSPIAAWDEATFLAAFRGGKVFAGRTCRGRTSPR
jgi:hypothetical protein